jgi:hypothetical protein
VCVFNQLLINPIIRTRTRVISGVYHYTRHNITAWKTVPNFIKLVKYIIPLRPSHWRISEIPLISNTNTITPQMVEVMPEPVVMLLGTYIGVHLKDALQKSLQSVLRRLQLPNCIDLLTLLRIYIEVSIFRIESSNYSEREHGIGSSQIMLCRLMINYPIIIRYMINTILLHQKYYTVKQ